MDPTHLSELAEGVHPHDAPWGSVSMTPDTAQRLYNWRRIVVTREKARSVMSEANLSLPDEFNALRDKVFIVTGGASGLGRDVAVQAAARGARVALLDVRADRLTVVK
jgi:hypothetical protein